MKIYGHEFTIGADPEIFIKRGDKPISAHNLIQGTKKEPFKVKNGAVQVDGTALEFNIDPAKDLITFSHNINEVMLQLKGMIDDADFIKETSIFWEKEYLNSLPKEATELGCDPDYNAYTLDVNPRPDDTSGMRTAGGHIHIGGFPCDDPMHPIHFMNCARLATYLDYYVGQYSLLWDNDSKRREMYGKAGSFRPKTYGMEYRTLSNAWIFDRRLINFVFFNVKEAIYRMFLDTDAYKYEVSGKTIDQSLKKKVYCPNDLLFLRSKNGN